MNFKLSDFTSSSKVSSVSLGLIFSSSNFAFEGTAVRLFDKKYVEF